MELMEFTKRSLPSTEITKLKTMGENPAFEWNTKCRSEPCDSIFEVILCPLVGHFDFRVIVAPAIIYERGGYLDEAREDVLVAGHSLEVNATTDIDFFIGIHQLQFIHEQIRTTLAILRFIKPENDSVLHDTSLTEDNNHSLNLQRGNVKDVRDSGIESEASTFYPTGSGQHSILRPTDEIVCKRTLSILPVRTSEHLSRPVVLPGVSLYGGRHFTPFELLLTAGHITVSFYSPEHSINLSERVKISKVSRETNNTGSAVTRPVSRKVDPVNEDHSSSTERRSTRRIKSKVKHRSAAASEIVSEMAG